MTHELSVFLFADRCPQASTQTLRKYLRNTITEKKRKWKGNVVGVISARKYDLILYNVFTKTTTPIHLDQLKEYSTQVKYTAISEIIQLHDGALVVSTKTNKLYVIKNEQQKIIDLGVDDANEPNVVFWLTQLKNGNVVLGYPNQVVFYNTNWRVVHVLKTAGEVVKELSNGRLVTAGSKSLKLWDNYSLVQQVTCEDLSYLWQYDATRVLFEGSKLVLWDMVTNTVSDYGVDKGTIVGVDLKLYELSENVLTNLISQKQVEAKDATLPSFWIGSFSEIDTDVIAWPNVNGVMTFDVTQETIKVYEVPSEIILRGYLME